MTIEQKLTELIMLRYGAISVFSKSMNMPNSTIVSILKRGVRNSSIDNVIKICKGLNISVDEIAEGKIVYLDKEGENKKPDIITYINEIKEAALTSGLTYEAVPLTEAEAMTLLDGIETALGIIQRNRARQRK